MKIACIGGGPAGLYFAISMKLRDPSHDIDLFERNPPGVTFGWGVVFSDQTVENLAANDPVSARIIADEFAHWDDIDVHFRGQCIRSSGHGFIGIGRKRLLEILQARARELGVVLRFEAECDPADPKWSGYDLVIAAEILEGMQDDPFEQVRLPRAHRPAQDEALVPARLVVVVGEVHGRAASTVLLRLRGDVVVEGGVGHHTGQPHLIVPGDPLDPQRAGAGREPHDLPADPPKRQARRVPRASDSRVALRSATRGTG